MLHVKALVSELSDIVNPLDGDMWKVSSISTGEVEAALEAGNFIDRPWNDIKDKIPEKLNTPDYHREIHIMRIAYLIKNRQLDDIPLLAIDHRETLTRAWFLDGNHRFAAAIVRNDKHFEVKIASNDDTGIQALLPGTEIFSPDES